MAETKHTKPMTALLNEDNGISSFDLSSVPAHLVSVLDLEKSTPVNLVKVDPLAVLKIVKHARESYPVSVNGQLLGLEIDGTLEVTNAFAVPTQPGSEEDMTNYQIEMIQCLREVNVDSSSVGWYQSTRLGDFMQQPLLDVQSSYQLSPNTSSVVLIHDTTKSEQSGNLSLRAFRLSQTYLDLAKAGKFTTEELAKRSLTYANILEEIPVHVESSALSAALLSELQWPSDPRAPIDLADSLNRPSSFNARLRAKRATDRSVGDEGDSGYSMSSSSLIPQRPTSYLTRPMCIESLDMTSGLSGGALARQLEAVGDLIDEHIHDANQWIYWQRGAAKEKYRRQQFVQRKKQANAARVARGEQPEAEPTEKDLDRMFKVHPEPSRLDSLLNSANLNLLTKGITQSRGPILTKMFAAQGLHES